MKPLKILYICTHNRCRSVLSEAITNQYAVKQGITNNTETGDEPKLIAKSAGSSPAGEVHLLTLKYLTEAGYSIQGLTSNSWEDSEYMGDFKPDLLITVCDNAAGETCPVWLGSLPGLTKLHWGMADPSKSTENEEHTKANFEQAITTIEQRVAQLLQVAQLPETERKQALLDLVK
ncbi:arsenate reductase ArsC [Psychrobacter sp. UBA3962]|uniref:arsenate reductase ArsC n=1 Tax=Psychrobacter sp. UBA3962 TaxID=1947352 RepID=UPI0025DEBD82|nr:arsenate reductase ArsC [Psychrobacter sp. UBA3962]